MECQCEREAKNSGQQDDEARARIWFHSAEACAAGDSIPDLRADTLYLLNPWLRWKCQHYPNTRLQAPRANSADAEEKCAGERLANAVASIKPDKLPFIRRCCPVMRGKPEEQERDLKRRAHKLGCWLARGTRFTDSALVVHLSELTPAERKMSDEQFAADRGLDVMDNAFLPNAEPTTYKLQKLSMGRGATPARVRAISRKIRSDRKYASRAEQQRAYRRRKAAAA